MKKYVILSYSIRHIGGTQLYIAGKAKYLEKNGWKVYVFFSDKKGITSDIPYLDKFANGAVLGLETQPGSYFKNIQEKVIMKMVEHVGWEKHDEIVIESHADTFALWGELLAVQLGAKHYCFICNEIFQGPGKCYQDNMDFFYFKLQRRELAGIHKDSISKLFSEYKKILPNQNVVFVAANDGAVQDVNNDVLNKIKKKDWTICYIGRITKQYVNSIIDDLCSFAEKYQDKEIQIVFVGDVTKKKQYIKEHFSTLKNITVIELGNLVPIPRKMFRMVDVVIAGSGCATCASMEGAFTIVPDARNCLANGLLGYDTLSSLYHEENVQQMHFDEALERVLVQKIYNRKKFNLPPERKAEEYYREHFALIEKSNQNKEYYSKITERGLDEKFIKTLKYCIKYWFPFLIQ